MSSILSIDTLSYVNCFDIVMCQFSIHNHLYANSLHILRLHVLQNLQISSRLLDAYVSVYSLCILIVQLLWTLPISHLLGNLVLDIPPPLQYPIQCLYPLFYRQSFLCVHITYSPYSYSAEYSVYIPSFN